VTVLSFSLCVCVYTCTVFVLRSRQRYNSEPGNTQSSYEGVHNMMPLLDDSAVITAARVCPCAVHSYIAYY